MNFVKLTKPPSCEDLFVNVEKISGMERIETPYIATKIYLNGFVLYANGMPEQIINQAYAQIMKVEK